MIHETGGNERASADGKLGDGVSKIEALGYVA